MLTLIIRPEGRFRNLKDEVTPEANKGHRPYKQWFSRLLMRLHSRSAYPKQPDLFSQKIEFMR